MFPAPLLSIALPAINSPMLVLEQQYNYVEQATAQTIMLYYLWHQIKPMTHVSLMTIELRDLHIFTC